MAGGRYELAVVTWQDWTVPGYLYWCLFALRHLSLNRSPNTDFFYNDTTQCSLLVTIPSASDKMARDPLHHTSALESLSKLFVICLAIDLVGLSLERRGTLGGTLTAFLKDRQKGGPSRCIQ